MTSSPHASRGGVAAALAAYLLWGLFPLFVKLLKAVPALEIVAHRVVWSVLLMAAVLAFGVGFRTVGEVLRTPRKLGRVAVGAGLILTNWLVFIWAINANRVLETSLGYFIGPLLSVLLALVVLRERLRPLQLVALLLAAVGVVNEAAHLGSLPWVSLALAGSFGLYGLLRKQLAMDAASGLFLETLIVLPLALGWLAWVEIQGGGHFARVSLGLDLLLVASGAATAAPLLFFAVAARRLSLTTLGFMQYLAPSISFLLAVFVFHESLPHTRLMTFAAIWIGLVIYSLDMLRARAKAA